MVDIRCELHTGWARRAAVRLVEAILATCDPNPLKIRKPCCEKLRDGPSVACRTPLSKRASSQRLWKLKV